MEARASGVRFAANEDIKETENSVKLLTVRARKCYDRPVVGGWDGVEDSLSWAVLLLFAGSSVEARAYFLAEFTNSCSGKLPCEFKGMANEHCFR